MQLVLCDFVYENLSKKLLISMEIFLKTKRIYLRKFKSTELDLLFQLDSDPDVMKFITLGKPRNMKEIKDISMPRLLKSYSNGDEYGIFCAQLLENNDFIGWFQFEFDKKLDAIVQLEKTTTEDYHNLNSLVDNDRIRHTKLQNHMQTVFASTGTCPTNPGTVFCREQKTPVARVLGA